MIYFSSECFLMSACVLGSSDILADIGGCRLHDSILSAGDNAKVVTCKGDCVNRSSSVAYQSEVAYEMDMEDTMDGIGYLARNHSKKYITLIKSVTEDSQWPFSDDESVVQINIP